MKTIIHIDDVMKRYPGASEYALKGITLTINQGDFFGLLGPNGSGKTTLVSILCGLFPMSSGRITMASLSMPQNFREIKSMIGLVPQEIALYPSLTFKENLLYFARLYGLTKKQILTRVQYCIKLAGLERFADQTIDSYSGGMKRRANLVTSLLHEPEILFLDEPTVNVDPQSRNMIFTILQGLNKKGTTIMYTTHYLEQAQKLCSRVAIIDHGNVLCIDRPDKLIEDVTGSKDLGDVFLELTGTDLRDI